MGFKEYFSKDYDKNIFPRTNKNNFLRTNNVIFQNIFPRTKTMDFLMNTFSSADNMDFSKD